LTLDDLISQVGYGRISARQVVNHFLVQEAPKEAEKLPEKEKKKPAASPSLGISLTGIDDVMVKFAKCCNPIPGDEISGYISRGRGITVHTQNCPHLKRLDTERIVEVNWDVRQKHAYPVHIKVVCNDRKGVITEVSSVITSFDINISFAQVETTDMIANCIFVIDVYDTQQLNSIFSAIRQLKIVRSIERIRKA
jgi:GTP pyrophosphokinase